MKLSVFNKTVILLQLLTVFLVGNMNGAECSDTCRLSDYELRKTIHHDISFVNNGTMEISNRYGKLDVHTWDKTDVQIDVEVLVVSSSKSKAKDQLDRILIEVNQQSDNIDISTIFDQEDSNWWSCIFGCSETNLEINYTMYIPKSTHLTVKNKYGDTNVGNIDNDLIVNVKYGNYSGKDVSGLFSIYVGYGKAYTGNVGVLNADVEYSLFKAKSAGSVTIESKYSKCYLDNCTDILIDSKYDSYYLGVIGDMVNEGKYDSYKISEARSITMDSKYTKLNCKYVEKLVDVDMQYGEIKIMQVSPVFEEAAIESKYTKIYLKMGNDYRYFIEAKYSSPSMRGDVVHSHFNQDGSYVSMQGIKGNNNAKATISISSKYGSIKID